MAEAMRYEIKIPLRDTPLFLIRRWLRLHPDAFRETFPPRQVNNIYFDSHDLICFSNHIDGIYTRQKLRLRWYGKAKNFNASQLEIKRKQGILGSKLIQQVHAPFSLQQQTWSHIQQVLVENLAPMQAEMIAVSRPVLVNWYQREYYESADGAIRLTMDFDHHTCDQRFTDTPNVDFPEPFNDIPLIEVKAHQQHYKRLANTLAAFPVRAEQFSKFLDGMTSIYSE